MEKPELTFVKSIAVSRFQMVLFYNRHGGQTDLWQIYFVLVMYHQILKLHQPLHNGIDQLCAINSLSGWAAVGDLWHPKSGNHRHKPGDGPSPPAKDSLHRTTPNMLTMSQPHKLPTPILMPIR
jgi:hypothetical protein